MSNKSEEKQISEFFVDYLNKNHNYDYVAELNIEEGQKDSDIDVYARSFSSKYPPLNLQIVTSDGEMKKESSYLRNIGRRTGQGIVMGQVFNAPFEEWISNEIGRKELKYSKEVKEHLILLVKFDLSLFNESYAKIVFEKFKTSEFLGIYAINLPKTLESSSRPHDGQIIIIKSATEIKEKTVSGAFYEKEGKQNRNF